MRMELCDRPMSFLQCFPSVLFSAVGKYKLRSDRAPNAGCWLLRSIVELRSNWRRALQHLRLQWPSADGDADAVSNTLASNKNIPFGHAVLYFNFGKTGLATGFRSQRVLGGTG